VLIQITLSQGRTVEQKRAFYRRITARVAGAPVDPRGYRRRQE
jgi:hypothetical protein